MKKLDKKTMNTINHYMTNDKLFAGKIEKIIICKEGAYSQGKFSSGFVTSAVVKLVTNGNAYQCFSGTLERMQMIAAQFNVTVESTV